MLFLIFFFSSLWAQEKSIILRFLDLYYGRAVTLHSPLSKSYRYKKFIFRPRVFLKKSYQGKEIYATFIEIWIHKIKHPKLIFSSWIVGNQTFSGPGFDIGIVGCIEKPLKVLSKKP